MGHPVREIGQGSGDGVDVEPASRESVTKNWSEASWRGASSESKNRYLVRGLSGGASGEVENRYLIRDLTRRASGESGYYPRWAEWSSRASDKVGVCRWLSLGFDIYKV